MMSTKTTKQAQTETETETQISRTQIQGKEQEPEKKPQKLMDLLRAQAAAAQRLEQEHNKVQPAKEKNETEEEEKEEEEEEEEVDENSLMNKEKVQALSSEARIQNKKEEEEQQQQEDEEDDENSCRRRVVEQQRKRVVEEEKLKRRKLEEIELLEEKIRRVKEKLRESQKQMERLQYLSGSNHETDAFLEEDENENENENESENDGKYYSDNDDDEYYNDDDNSNNNNKNNNHDDYDYDDDDDDHNGIFYGSQRKKQLQLKLKEERKQKIKSLLRGEEGTTKGKPCSTKNNNNHHHHSHELRLDERFVGFHWKDILQTIGCECCPNNTNHDKDHDDNPSATTSTSSRNSGKTNKLTKEENNNKNDDDNDKTKDARAIRYISITENFCRTITSPKERRMFLQTTICQLPQLEYLFLCLPRDQDTNANRNLHSYHYHHPRGGDENSDNGDMEDREDEEEYDFDYDCAVDCPLPVRALTDSLPQAKRLERLIAFNLKLVSYQADILLANALEQHARLKQLTLWGFRLPSPSVSAQPTPPSPPLPSPPSSSPVSSPSSFPLLDPFLMALATIPTLQVLEIQMEQHQLTMVSGQALHRLFSSGTLHKFILESVHILHYQDDDNATSADHTDNATNNNNKDKKDNHVESHSSTYVNNTFQPLWTTSTRTAGSCLRELELTSCTLSSKCCTAIAHMLQNNTTIQKLNLSYSTIIDNTIHITNDDDDQHHHDLDDHSDHSHNNDDEDNNHGINSIIPAANPANSANATNHDADDDHDCIVAFAKALETNTSLKCLKLGNIKTGIRPSGVLAFANMLRKNSTLVSLSLFTIDDKGCIAISNALQTMNRTLQELDIQSLPSSNTNKSPTEDTITTTTNTRLPPPTTSTITTAASTTTTTTTTTHSAAIPIIPTPLPTSNTINRIAMDNNTHNDDDVHAFFSSSSSSSSFSGDDARTTSIGHRGYTALIQMLKKNYTLRSLRTDGHPDYKQQIDFYLQTNRNLLSNFHATKQQWVDAIFEQKGDLNTLFYLISKASGYIFY